MAVLSLGWSRVGLASNVQVTWATLRRHRHVPRPVSQPNCQEFVKPWRTQIRLSMSTVRDPAGLSPTRSLTETGRGRRVECEPTSLSRGCHEFNGAKPYAPRTA
jgi:hypothetical protein